MLKRNILLVEDDGQNSLIIKFILSHAGYMVKEAANGYDALDRIDKYHFDLILLDLNMPMMNGFEFLERLRKMKEHKDIPVIILTTRNDVKSIKKAKILGVDQYIVKPPEKESLLKKIENLLGGEPQYHQLSLEADSNLAAVEMNYQGTIKSVSEVGMVMYSPIPMEMHTVVREIGGDLFKQLGIVKPKLFVCECHFDEKKNCYVLFLSFSDLSESHIRTIRQWVVGESLKRRAA